MSYGDRSEVPPKPRTTGGGPDFLTKFKIPGSPQSAIGNYFNEKLNSASNASLPDRRETDVKEGFFLKNEYKNSDEKLDSYKTQVAGLGSENISASRTQASKNHTSANDLVSGPGEFANETHPKGRLERISAFGTQASKNHTSTNDLISSLGKSTNEIHPKDAQLHSKQALKTLKKGNQFDIYESDGLPKLDQGDEYIKKAGKAESSPTVQDGQNSSELVDGLANLSPSLNAEGLELMSTPFMNATKHKDPNYVTPNASHQPGDQNTSKSTATNIEAQSILDGSIDPLQGSVNIGMDDSNLKKFLQGSEDNQAQYANKANHSTSISQNSTSKSSNSTNNVIIGGNFTLNNPLNHSNTTALPESTMISTNKEYSNGKLVSNTTKKTALNTTGMMATNLTFPGNPLNGEVRLSEEGDLTPDTPLISSPKRKTPKISDSNNASVTSNLNFISKNYLSASKLGTLLSLKPKANLSLSLNTTNQNVTNRDGNSHGDNLTNNQSILVNSSISHTPVNHIAQVLGDGKGHNTSNIDVAQASQDKIKSNSQIMLNATSSISSESSLAVATNVSSSAKSHNVKKKQEADKKQSSSDEMTPSRFRPVITEELNPFFSAFTTKDSNDEAHSDLIGSRFHRSTALAGVNEGYRKDSDPTVLIKPAGVEIPEDPPILFKSIPRVTTQRFGGITPIPGLPSDESDMTRNGSTKTKSLMGSPYRPFYPKYTPAPHAPKYIKTQQVHAASVGLSFSVGFFFLAVLGMVIERKRKRKAQHKRSLDHHNFKRDLEKYGGFFESRLFANQESEIGSLREDDRESVSYSCKTISYPAPVIKRLSMNSYAEIGRDSLRSYTRSLRTHNSQRYSYASSFGNTNEEDIAEFNDTYASRPSRLDYNPVEVGVPQRDFDLPKIHQNRFPYVQHLNRESERFPTSPELDFDDHNFTKHPPLIYHSNKNHSLSGSDIILDRFLEDLSELNDSSSIIVTYSPRRRQS
ncbi:hypothetical protein DFH28DRAFT_13714 [Melampsora americana]|nr:hypothetical protein DFH28DRAFT_13714 [Melampsora americana]